jgi:hypothetical protein
VDLFERRLIFFLLGGVDKRVLYIDVMSGKIVKKYHAHAGRISVRLEMTHCSSQVVFKQFDSMKKRRLFSRLRSMAP